MHEKYSDDAVIACRFDIFKWPGNSKANRNGGVSISKRSKLLHDISMFIFVFEWESNRTPGEQKKIVS